MAEAARKPAISAGVMVMVGNRGKGPRVMYDVFNKAHTFAPGESKEIELPEGTSEYYDRLNKEPVLDAAGQPVPNSYKDKKPDDPTRSALWFGTAAGETDEVKALRASIKAAVEADHKRALEQAKQAEKDDLVKKAIEPVAKAKV